MATDTASAAQILLPCPFCGGSPTTTERPDNIDGTQFFCAIACYCGRHSACAHKMAVRKTPEIAKADAIAAWNTRAPQPTQAQAGAVPPAVAGKPVAWLSTDCIGERYLCFTKPEDSDHARPLVFGDATPQPIQEQAGAVPLTDEQIQEAILPINPHGMGYFLRIARAIERAHGIPQKGGS